MVISENIVIVNFLFILVTFQSGIMAFLTSIHCCPECPLICANKQRKNVWTAIPVLNSSRRLNKIRKWLFQKIVVDQYYRTNQMILYHSFKEDNVLSDDIKICYIFQYQSNKNWAFRFFWDTRYTKRDLIVWHELCHGYSNYSYWASQKWVAHRQYLNKF